MKARDAERLLVLMLRLGGSLMLLAAIAVFMPASWINATHQALGFGEFPATPLVNYLARSASGMYAIHGGFLLMVSMDVRAYRALISYVGYSNLVFGLVLLWIDFNSGMPAYWIWIEGPAVVAIGLGLLRLNSISPDEQ